MSELSLSFTSNSDDVSALTHSPLTQSPRSLQDGSTVVESDGDDEYQHVDQRVSTLDAVTSLADQISLLQTKMERLGALREKLQSLAWFDQDDVELVQKEFDSAQLKLDAIKASVSRGDAVYMHVTLKRRESFLESAVRQNLLDPDKDRTLFHALVKKQVYLTRLANNRVVMQQ